jgi:hypothetical protein
MQSIKQKTILLLVMKLIQKLKSKILKRYYSFFLGMHIFAQLAGKENTTCTSTGAEMVKLIQYRNLKLGYFRY